MFDKVKIINRKVSSYVHTYENNKSTGSLVDWQNNMNKALIKLAKGMFPAYRRYMPFCWNWLCHC